jgi:hypothetical protein
MNGGETINPNAGETSDLNHRDPEWLTTTALIIDPVGDMQSRADTTTITTEFVQQSLDCETSSGADSVASFSPPQTSLSPL